ncbi:MAG TPA: PHB depolymerase family esterase [Kofleriaceae bacterium]
MTALRGFVLVSMIAGCRGPDATSPQPQAAPATARHHELFVPSDQPNLPLVIALHGNGGSGRQMERLTGFDQIAAREHFVVAYPDGIDHHWNDGRPELDTGVDDVAYLAGLIDELVQQHSIDRSRIYVTGFSNGAMMSFRLACDLSDRIAAVAPVAGNLPSAIHCAPQAPLSVLIIDGTADPLVPYEGGVVGAKLRKNRGTVLSSALSIEQFARTAQCGDPHTVDEPDLDPNDGTRARRTAYTCPAGLGVELVTVDGGGHTWAGGEQYAPAALIGPVSRDFSASERIWEFFAAHPRAARIATQPR